MANNEESAVSKLFGLLKQLPLAIAYLFLLVTSGLMIYAMASAAKDNMCCLPLTLLFAFLILLFAIRPVVSYIKTNKLDENYSFLKKMNGYLDILVENWIVKTISFISVFALSLILVLIVVLVLLMANALLGTVCALPAGLFFLLVTYAYIFKPLWVRWQKRERERIKREAEARERKAREEAERRKDQEQRKQQEQEAERKRREAEEQERKRKEEAQHEYERAEQERRKKQENEQRKKQYEEDSRSSQFGGDYSNEYMIFDLPRTASFDDFKKKFKLLARIYHPDKHNSDKELYAEANRKMRDLNLAWQRIKIRFGK